MGKHNSYIERVGKNNGPIITLDVRNLKTCHKTNIHNLGNHIPLFSPCFNEGKGNNNKSEF